jgi:hypothetical protein
MARLARKNCTSEEAHHMRSLALLFCTIMVVGPTALSWAHLLDTRIAITKAIREENCAKARSLVSQYREEGALPHDVRDVTAYVEDVCANREIVRALREDGAEPRREPRRRRVVQPEPSLGLYGENSQQHTSPHQELGQQPRELAKAWEDLRAAQERFALEKQEELRKVRDAQEQLSVEVARIEAQKRQVGESQQRELDNAWQQVRAAQERLTREQHAGQQKLQEQQDRLHAEATRMETQKQELAQAKKQIEETFAELARSLPGVDLAKIPEECRRKGIADPYQCNELLSAKGRSLASSR